MGDVLDARAADRAGATFGDSAERASHRWPGADGQLRDADLRVLTEALRTTRQQLDTVLELSSEAIACYDAELRYRYVNPAAARGFGLDPSAIVGRTDAELDRCAVFRSSWEPALRQVLRSGRRTELDLTFDDDGRTRWIHAWIAPELGADGEVVSLLASVQELTDQKRAEQAAVHQALHDPVTGLPNRVLLLDRLERAIARTERQPGVVALLVVDLDDFKIINDAHGHEAGDRVLAEVGHRLGAVSRGVDTVARLGGDQFALLCDGLSDDEAIRAIADRILRTLRRPIEANDRMVQLSGSVGIVANGDRGAGDHDAPTLVRHAEAAMEEAKRHGRNRYRFFDPGQRERAAARDELALELRHALEVGQLDLHYQPLFSLADRRIVGVEALLRWPHPERGMIPPGEFIGVAEDRGLMVPIGAWVLERACAQLAEWTARRHADAPPLTLAVNVSAHQLRDPDLVRTVREVLARHEIPPSQLCLEITETALITEGPETLLVLELLSELGINIALDDFGTGFSSLAHLRTFPVDVLKIDRSFVERLSLHGRDREIVAAVTAMAHVLGMTVVGEGIETEGQLGELTDLACDDGQGYLLSRPLPADRLTSLLAC